MYMIKLIRGHRTVSYTHLDVYKRQDMPGAMEATPIRTPYKIRFIQLIANSLLLFYILKFETARSGSVVRNDLAVSEKLVFIGCLLYTSPWAAGTAERG